MTRHINESARLAGMVFQPDSDADGFIAFLANYALNAKQRGAKARDAKQLAHKAILIGAIGHEFELLENLGLWMSRPGMHQAITPNMTLIDIARLTLVYHASLMMELIINEAVEDFEKTLQTSALGIR